MGEHIMEGITSAHENDPVVSNHPRMSSTSRGLFLKIFFRYFKVQKSPRPLGLHALIDSKT